MRRFLTVFVYLLLVFGPLLLPGDPAVLPGAPEDGADGACELRGYVTRFGPVAGAVVEVRLLHPLDPEMPYEPYGWFYLFDNVESNRGEPLATATTDEAGAFVVRGLPTGALEVLAVANDGATGHRTVELYWPGTRSDGSVRIPTGPRTIRGRAVWADGRPFPGIVSAGSVRAWTDAEGGFVLRGVSNDPEVRVILKGVLSRGPFDVRDGITLTVNEGMAPVRGRILDRKGNGIAGAEVVLSGESGARTDGEGCFSAWMPDAGGWASARAKGFLAFRVDVPPDLGEIELNLERAPRITGVVRSDEDGSPVPGVPVYAVTLSNAPIESGRFLFDGKTRAITDGSGRFEIDAPSAGAVMVFAFGRGWVSVGLDEATEDGYNPAVIEVVAGESRSFDIEAVRSPSLQGRVVGPEGEGVPGVYVWTREDLPLDRGHHWRWGWLQDLGSAVTDDEGRFRLATALPGTRFWVRAEPGVRPGAVSKRLLLRDDDVSVLVIDLPPEPPARRLEVAVVEAASGAPISGATVYVSNWFEGEEVDVYLPSVLEEPDGPDAVTDAKGMARFAQLPPGRLSVAAAHPKHRFFDHRTVEGSGGSSAELTATVRLEPGMVLAGQVVLPDGTPAAGARFLGPGPRADAGGRFRFENAEPDTSVTVQVRSFHHGGRVYRGSAVIPAGTEDAVIMLHEGNVPPAFHLPPPPPRGSEGPAFDISVLDPDGEPVTAGVVEVHPIDNSGPRGPGSRRARVLPLEEPPARYVLGYREDAFWINVLADAPGAGRTLVGPITSLEPVEIRLGAARRIAGAVLDPDGAGVRGVRVLALPYAPKLLEAGGEPGPHDSAWTDASGEFVLDGLGNGPYLLAADGPDAFMAGESTIVRTRGERVALRLRVAARPVVTVLDQDDMPLAGARVHAHSPDSGSTLSDYDAVTFALTDADGMARLGGLDPDVAWTLVVEPPEEDEESMAMREIEDWRPVDTEVRLNAKGLVEGVVLDLEGFPVPLAEVWYRAEGDEEWESAYVGERGDFELEDLPPGPAELLVGRFGAEIDDPANVSVRVEEGETTVRVTIDSGPSLRVRVPGWTGGRAEAVLAEESRRRTPATLSEEGIVRFSSLEVGKTYDFYVGPLPDGRMAHAKGLAPGGEEHRVEVRAGLTIRVRVEAPEGARDLEVDAFGNPSFRNPGVRAEDGTFLVSGLFAGRWLISAECRANGREWKGHAWIDAGGEGVVKLRER